jgi:4-hydroxybenzoate polyprenyltransferase
MATDINQKTYILRKAPPAIEPYIRLARIDRLTGFWLLLLPALWGLGLACFPHLPQMKEVFLVTLGAFLMRSAGCICNDLTDQKYDMLVKRTQTRPLADGSLTRFQATIFLAILLSIAALILFQLNLTTIMLGVTAAIMVIIYPWMKRITFWPQAFLGITFNIGALMSWTLIRDKLEFAPLMMYLAAFFWTLHYDTIYAYQDKEDDQMIGVRSSALKLGNHTMIFLIFCSMSFFVLMAAVGLLLYLPLSYYIMLSLATVFLLYESVTTDINHPETCYKSFKRAQIVGWIVLIGILSGGANEMVESFF